MSARRSQEPGDSLELLLDTICNAFGGILFLTILLTMFLRLSHPKSDNKKVSEAARREMTELGDQLEIALSELESLERSLAVQTQTRSRLVDADLEEQYRDLEQLRERQQRIERSILETSRAAAREQQQVDAIGAKSEALDRDLNRTKTAVNAAAKKLDAEQQRRTKSVVPPHTRTSHKRELGLVVRYGRVYEERRWDRSRTSMEPNLDDFVVLGESGGFVKMTPKPYKGLPIDETATFSNGLDILLTPYDANQWHLCASVWEDSFENFLVLKKVLLARGYEIRLLALADGESTYEGNVPNPQVQ
jgi:hypothetical protein